MKLDNIDVFCCEICDKKVTEVWQFKPYDDNTPWLCEKCYIKFEKEQPDVRETK